MQPERPWPRSLEEARAIQRDLRERVVACDRLGPVRTVAGADGHYPRGDGRARGAAVVLEFPRLALLASAVSQGTVAFPYVPGLLSFREAPLVLDALARLPRLPDLLLVDGHGLAHPERCGLACHVGVLADLPTVGVAKSRLVGRYDEPGPDRGSWSALVDRGQVIGAVLRTRAAVRPLFVSVGHRVSLATALELVLRCAPRFRLPEPVRLADALARRGALPGEIS